MAALSATGRAGLLRPDGRLHPSGLLSWQASGAATKSPTYAVEADNAELRHSLAGLGRRSRYFTRCLSALRDAVKLFVSAWNRRQFFRRAHPQYPAHISDFVYP
jgi:hypothetical protein